MVKLKKNFLLLKKIKIYERLDIYPFIIIYIILILIIHCFKLTNIFTNKIIIFGTIGIFQSILYFSKFFSINIMIEICYFPTNSIENATHVKVDIYSEDFVIRRILICQIIRENIIIKTEFQKNIYIYDKDKEEFHRAKFEELKKNKIGKFLQSKPLTQEQIIEKRAIFGENKIKIPIPSFFSLYK